MPFQKQPEICPICKQGKKFKFIRDFEKENRKFSLYECLECQVQFWLPLEAPGIDWYLEKGFMIKNVLKPEIYRGYHKKFLKMHESFPKGTRVLDLGCSAGEFIFELQKRGCEVWGVDFDKESIKIARERFCLKKVFAMTFDQFFQKKDLPQFDMITFFEAIAYLTDPLEFIKNLKKLLKPGGKVVLSAPSRERMLADLSNWDFPLNYFTRWNEQAISNLFQKQGFVISRVDYTEQFKTFSEAMTSSFRTGLASSLVASENKKKSILLLKIVYFLGCLKYYAIGTIPATFLWLIGKISKRKNGTMLVELKRNYE